MRGMWGQSDQAKTEGAAKTEETADTGEDAEAASKDSGDVKIAYIVKAMSDQFWIDMKEGADKAAEELGVVVDFQAPEKRRM